MKLAITLATVVFLSLIKTSFQQCYAPDCPYGCCKNENACNLREDCLLEEADPCIENFDCLSDCCYKRQCAEQEKCKNSVVIVAVTIPIIFFGIVCSVLGFYLYQTKKTKKRLKKEDEEVAPHYAVNRKRHEPSKSNRKPPKALEKLVQMKVEDIGNGGEQNGAGFIQLPNSAGEDDQLQ